MTGKIISREESERLNASGTAVRNLLQSPQEQSERLFNEAYRTGLLAGREAGLREFLTATAEAVRAIREDFLKLEPMLAPLVLQGVQKIIGALPSEDVARRAIAEVMKEGGAGLAATLRVPPEELDLMRRAVQDLAQDRPDLAKCLVAIEADPGLKRGEMLLETLKGRTHFGIDYQLARLKYAMEATTR